MTKNILSLVAGAAAFIGVNAASAQVPGMDAVTDAAKSAAGAAASSAAKSATGAATGAAGTATSAAKDAAKKRCSPLRHATLWR